MVADPATLFVTTLYPAGIDDVGDPVRIKSCVVPPTVCGARIVPEDAVTERVPAAANALAICCATERPVPVL
jgi:hypothetical protein